jgi:hypothetical protein
VNPKKASTMSIIGPSAVRKTAFDMREMVPSGVADVRIGSGEHVVALDASAQI